MKKIKTIIIFAVIINAMAILCCTNSASAAAKNMATCKNAPETLKSIKNGEIVQNRCNGMGVGQYGMLFPAPQSSSSKYPETTGSGDIKIDIIRSVYDDNRGDTYSHCDAVDIEFISYSSGGDSFNYSGMIKDVKYKNKNGRIAANCAHTKNAWGPVSATRDGSGNLSGDYATLTIDSSKLNLDTHANDGSYAQEFKYYRCVWYGYYKNGQEEHKGCRIDTYPAGFYKIAELTGVTTVDSVDGATLNSSDGKYYLSISSGNVTVKFNHTLSRAPGGWTDSITNGSLKYCTARDSDTCEKTAKTSMTTTSEYKIKVSDIPSNQDYKVCSRIYFNSTVGLSGYSKSTGNGKSDKVCVTLYDDRTFLNASSKSSVDNSIDTGSVTNDDSDTIESWDGSRNEEKTYPYYFVHQLKVKGDAGRTVDLTYNIERSTDGGSTWKKVVPNTTKTVAGNNSWVEVRGYSDSLDSFIIKPGKSSPTVCERINFKSKRTEFVGVSTVGTGNGEWGSSTICTRIKRQKAKKTTMSATCSAMVDSAYNTTGVFNFTFGFNIDRDNTTQNLSTKYTIKRSVNGGTSTVVKGPTSITVPKNGITDSPTITFSESEYGSSKQVCETIHVDPYQYAIQLKPDGTEETITGADAIGGGKDLATCCETVAMPEQHMRDDGEITIYSESTATVDPSTSGEYNSTIGAYLLKGDRAIINYTHKLWRESEKHQGDGVHQAAVISPEEDVEVKYRLGANSAANDNAFTPAYFDSHSSIPSTMIATNTANNKFTTHSSSNSADTFLNENTSVTVNEVGGVEERCQSIYYVSNNYLLRGRYWEMDGEIYPLNPEIQGRERPVRSPKPDGSTGKSVPACVKIARPYNFKVKKLTPDTISPVQTIDEPYTTTFNMKVGKNKSDYLITDIYNATVQYIGFKITNLSGSYPGNLNYGSGSPCNYYEGLGVSSCTVLEEQTGKNYGRDASTNGKKYYADSLVCNASGDCSYDVNNLSVEHTLDDSVQLNEKYCIAVGIKSANSGDGFNFSNTWAISTPSCVNVGKYPNMQVWGGSVFSSGGIITSITKYHEKYYGSWGDFAIIANSVITKTASGASLISGAGTSDTCTLSTITISNDNCNGHNALRSRLGQANITAFSVEDFKRKLYNRYLQDPNNYHIISTLDSSSLTNSRNPFIAYNPSGNIFITSDVEFGNGAYDKHNVPQAIIYAKGNVYISDQVKHIVAWIIADGTVNTCADASGNTPALTEETCKEQLIVDGPIIASKVKLNRTHGANGHENTSTTPAEIVNLNSSVYLFSHYQATGDQPVTTHIQKMPARY